MEPHWAPRARELAELGYNNRQIADLVGRTRQRVGAVLNRVRRPGGRDYGTQPKLPVSEKTRLRQLDRRWCRIEAERTGQPVAELYRKYECERVDPSRQWD